ncbi:MAG: hypothetical protein HQ581_05865 [Planctomycetes bacterium]|nr:hypothetical protein [Planctomycetota bacterium]
MGFQPVAIAQRRSPTPSPATKGTDMPPPPEIVALVNRFADHGSTYRWPGYNEAQLRKEFLNPFFAALGWDVYK